MMPVIRMFVTMTMVVIHNAWRGNILGIFYNTQLKRILAPGPAKIFSLYWLAHLSFWVKEGDTPKLHLFAILRLVQSFIHPCWPEGESFIHPWPEVLFTSAGQKFFSPLLARIWEFYSPLARRWEVHQRCWQCFWGINLVSELFTIINSRSSLGASKLGNLTKKTVFVNDWLWQTLLAGGKLKEERQNK